MKQGWGNSEQFWTGRTEVMGDILRMRRQRRQRLVRTVFVFEGLSTRERCRMRGKDVEIEPTKEKRTLGDMILNGR